MSRQVVMSPFYPVSDNLDVSHRGGWARYWAHALSRPDQKVELLTTKTMRALDDLKKGDTVHLYHGMEFKGQMNLQSGLTDEILERAQRLLTAKKRGVKFVSLDHICPNYGKLLQERGMDPTSSDALSALCKSSATLMVPTTTPETLIVGDSHSLSQYIPGSVIYRQDGKTLFGALERSLSDTISDFIFETELEYDKVKTVIFYFGNIDIRHHLARQPKPTAAAKELAVGYVKQMAAIKSAGVDVKVVMPLPIEDESRQIPKSGWFKGEPFAGSWQERNKLRKIFADTLAELCKRKIKTIEHPSSFYDGKKLSFDVMEKPRSVHIRPSEYAIMWKGGW